ncbi:MAG: SixA phosphatase family protein [Bacteroidia bacterium]
MKKLLLLRHASASIDSPTRQDIDRPLNYDGINEAELMVKFLRTQKIPVDLIISSTAFRAVTTAQIFARFLFYPLANIQKEKNIFSNNPDDLIAVLHSFEDDKNGILFVGHNPGITELANVIGSPAVPNFKPAGIACIEFEIDSWKEIEKNGVLKFYVDPLTVADLPPL